MKATIETTERNWYDDACGAAFAMELVGERWSLLIVRELMFGPRRFSELKASLKGISAKTLTERLNGMEQTGILARTSLPMNSAHAYELTRWGYGSAVAIRELGRWAVRSPRHDVTLGLSSAALMMSMQTCYAGGCKAKIGFKIADDVFVATATADTLEVARGDPFGAEALIEGPASAIAAILYSGLSPAEAETGGSVHIKGDPSAIARYVECLEVPDKIAD